MTPITFEDFRFRNLKDTRDLMWLVGTAPLRKLISEERADYLRNLIFEENKGDILRRDFTMPYGEHTPRNMSVISGHTLNAIPELHALYHDPRLINTIESVVRFDFNDFPVEIYPDPLENMVATRLEKESDTHGYHLDDPSLALIVCLEAPPEGGGGEVEFDPFYPRAGHSYTLEKGDAYLMVTNKMMHRVAPLRGPFTRSVLNLTYHQGPMPAPNGSADLLFSP